MGLRHVAVIVVGAALGAAALAIARSEPGGALGADSVAGGLALLGAGWALAGVGVAAWARRPSSRFGTLLAAAGCAWLLVEFDNPGVGWAPAFTVGLATAAACPPLVAHAALAYPDGRLRSGIERAALAVAYASTLGLLGIGSALVFDPARQGCSQCPDNLLAVTSGPGLLGALGRDGVRLGVAWPVVLAGLAALRLVRASRAARLVTGPVLVPAIGYLGLVGADYAHTLHRGFLSNDAVDERLWGAQALALVAVAAGVVAAWVRARRAREAIVRLVVELDAAPEASGLRDALARALADPDLEIAYPVAGGGHVDAAGRPVDAAPAGGRVATPLLGGGGRVVAVLVHRNELLDDPGLVDEVAAAARLALEHERLQAELSAQLEALRASRARTVAAGDAERRRLERDLHDGAQQRLVLLAFAIGLLRDRLGPAGAAHADAAAAELRAALDDLRDLGRGIYPAVLADEGLAAAVEALAEDSAVPIAVGPMPSERVAAPVEAAAYFLVADIVRALGAGGVTVTGELCDGRLVVEVAGTGALDGDLVELQDRIGALDGVVTVRRAARDSVAVRAEVPCGS